MRGSGILGVCLSEAENFYLTGAMMNSKSNAQWLRIESIMRQCLTSSNFPMRPGKPPEMPEAVHVRAWGSLRHGGEAWLAQG